MDKKELRKILIQKLKMEKMPTSESVKEILMNNGIICAADNIFAYVPFKTEIDITSYLDWAVDNKSVFLPFCREPRELFYTQIYSGWQKGLTKSENKTMVPICRASVNLNTIAGNTVILIPALGFSSDGYRLGRGGGYYDCFLRKLKNNKNFISIGLGIKDQLIEFKPDSFDEKLDKLILI